MIPVSFTAGIMFSAKGLYFCRKCSAWPFRCCTHPTLHPPPTAPPPSPLHHSSPASLTAWSSERFSSTGELKHLHQTKDKEKNLCPSLAGCFIQALMQLSRMHGSSSQCSSTWQHTCHECFVYVCSQQGDIQPPPPSPQDNNNNKKTGNNNKNFLHTCI